jgi:hypothetical protein
LAAGREIPGVIQLYLNLFPLVVAYEILLDGLVHDELAFAADAVDFLTTHRHSSHVLPLVLHAPEAAQSRRIAVRFKAGRLLNHFSAWLLDSAANIEFVANQSYLVAS